MDIADDDEPMDDQYEAIDQVDGDEFILMNLKSPDDVSSMLSGENQEENYPEMFVEERLTDDEDDKTTLVLLPTPKTYKRSHKTSSDSSLQDKQFCTKCDKSFSTKSMKII